MANVTILLGFSPTALLCNRPASFHSSFLAGDSNLPAKLILNRPRIASARTPCSAQCKQYAGAFQGDHVLKISRQVACGLCVAITIFNAWPSITLAAAMRLPPLSTEPNRCEKAFVGNTIGQANGVYDKPLDLRFCDFTNDKTNLKGKSLSAALMSDAKFDGADMSEVVMSKAYAVGASFKGTDFTNAVIDRVAFDRSDLQGAKFQNTVLSGSTFVNANLKDTVFDDALIGYVDLQKLCKNTTLAVDTRDGLGCKP